MTARRSSREKGDGLSKARRLRLLVGTGLLALSVILTGCSGSRTQERKEDYEKMKMLKKQEEKKQEEKEKEEKSQTGIRTAIAPIVSHQELPGA
jgi:predicted phage tail protein